MFADAALCYVPGMDPKSAQETVRLAQERTELARQRVDLATRRTRLANKRTLLAWMRTALSVMAFGFVLEKVDVFVSGGLPGTRAINELDILGLTTFIAGPLMAMYGGWRYWATEKLLGYRAGITRIVLELGIFLVLLAASVYFIFSTTFGYLPLP